MKVYVNSEIRENILSLDELKDFIENIKIECKKSNKIMQIFINDVFVEQLPLGINKDDINEIHIQIKSPIEFVIEGMIESVNYLPRLREGLSQSATLFQQGNHGEGISLFQKSNEGLIWLNQLLTSFQIYIEGNEQLGMEGLYFQSDIKRFNETLKELLNAWENEDYVLISDLIEYELVMVLEDIQKNFTKALDKLAGV